MQTKIVYVLVSQESDFFYEMFLMSHYSLRLYHPKGDVEVNLIMDMDTYQRLKEKQAEILQDVIPIVSYVPKEYSVMQRSRYLKTSMRELLQGDFLYLDTDTIVCHSLDAVDSFKTDICLVRDNHQGKVDNYQVDQVSDVLGWKHLAETKLFNGGVIYVKDSIQGHDFFKKWHESWKLCASHGFNKDQLSLRWVVSQSENIIKELDGTWNCQVSMPSSIEYQNDAIIMHYFSSAVCRKHFDICCDSTLMIVRLCGTINNFVAEKIKFSNRAFIFQCAYLTHQDFVLLNNVLSTKKDYPKYFWFIVKVSELHKRFRETIYKIRHH